MATINNVGAEKKLQERMKTAKDVTDKENRDGHKSLTQAKGRGQVTATTAMSIVNVALLKSVLDRGPSDNKYYEVSLVLISVSLALQILAGLMCLVIEQTLGYLSKYGGNFCEDAADYCCPWRCVKNKLFDHEHVRKESAQGTGRSKRLVEEESPWEKQNPNVCDLEAITVLADASEDPLCECCPFVITNKVYAQHEINTLEKFHKWRMAFVDNELAVLRGDNELAYQVSMVAESKKKLAELTESLKKPDADSADIDRRIAQLNAELVKAKERKEKYESTLRKAEIVREQGIILKEYATSIRKNRVLKQAGFWQQILNYIFYIIFILNAFITGFGLDTKPHAVVNDTSTNPSI